MRTPHTVRKILAMAFFALAVLFGPDLPAQQKLVAVDAGKDLGPISIQIGTNCGPYSMQGLEDYTQIYKDLGFTAIRTHDYYGPCDWYTIFPDWFKPADDPSSYDFSSTDGIIKKIIDGGFEVLFRIGPSWHDPVREHHTDPPGTLRDNQGNITHAADLNDFVKFAEICKRIVMHYNAGWADGYQYNIRKWEIWNEPTLEDHFWSGTPLQFYLMFETAIKSLKNYDSSLIIGGPGLAGTPREAYREHLIAYCAQNNVSLDFFSWHCYGRIGQTQDQSPNEFSSRSDSIRNLLDTYGYTDTLSICDEWNAGLNVAYFGDSGRGAAFYACALTAVVNKDIPEFYQYRGDDHVLGLVKSDGSLRTAAYSLKAWKLLAESTIRLEATGPEDSEFTAIASRSTDKKTLWVLISNFLTEAQQTTLQMNNLPLQPENGWIMDRQVINDTLKLELTDSTNIGGGANLSHSFDMQPESVQLLKFTPAPASEQDDSSESGKKCAIATASFGTPAAEGVRILQYFRDHILLSDPTGQALVEVYEAISPELSEFIMDKEPFKAVIREILKPFIWLISRIITSPSYSHLKKSKLIRTD